MFTFAELRAAVPARPAGTNGAAPNPSTRQPTPGRGQVGQWPLTPDQAAAEQTDRVWRRIRDSVHGVNVNTELLNGACAAGQFIPAFWTWEEAVDYCGRALLTGPHASIGRTALSDKDRGTIRSGLEHGMRTPHRLTDDDADAAPVAPAEPTAADDADAEFERLVADRFRRKLADREADRRLTEQDRAGRPTLAESAVDVRDLHTIPRPSFLLGGLIPDRAVGFLFAAHGTYKTFTAVSWACTLAVGRAWLDRAEFAVAGPVRVLYVAAEGPSGVAERVAAWEAAHGVEVPAGMLTVVPRPVRLDDVHDAAELDAYVRDGGYGLAIVDTYHRSAPNTNEDNSGEFGRVFDAVARLRDDHGCGSLLLDHTGHAGQRGRGSSAKGDDADYVLTIRGRTLHVDKLKDVPDGQEHPIRLRPVPEVRGARGGPSAVVEIGTTDPDTFDHHGDPWWLDPLPDDVAAGITGTGKVLAADVVRFLRRNVDNPDGFTRDEIRAALKECPRYRDRAAKAFTSVWSEGWSCVRRGGAELAAPGGATSSRFVLAEHLRPGAK